jgi:dUTP pyrophosphatase
VANAPGLIDAGYRGELMVLLANHTGEPYRVAEGDRVAQLVVTPVALAPAAWADELPASDGRGEGGMGSTGR